MQDRSDRFQIQTPSSSQPKRLGSYLVEAGLITSAQVDVALNDQKIMSDMRFGDVLVARGWIKQQTLDYLIKKVVEPEQQAAKQTRSKLEAQNGSTAAPSLQEAANFVSAWVIHDRSPLPDDEDVSWVG